MTILIKFLKYTFSLVVCIVSLFVIRQLFIPDELASSFALLWGMICGTATIFWAEKLYK